MRQLLLRKSKEEISLVLGAIDSAQKLVAAGFRVAADASIMARGDAVRANLPGCGEELGKLDFRIAEAARDGSLARQIPLHKWPDHGRFKLLFQIDDVIGNVEKAGHGARVVDVIERAAAPRGAATFARLFAQQIAAGGADSKAASSDPQWRAESRRATANCFPPEEPRRSSYRPRRSWRWQWT